VGLVVASFSEAIGFGEDTETVWPSTDLTYDVSLVTISGTSWSASAETVVTTVDYGTDVTVLSISSITVSVTGEVTFEPSYDSGVTWGTALTADEVCAKTDWQRPLRFRINMPTASRVNGMSFSYER